MIVQGELAPARVEVPSTFVNKYNAIKDNEKRWQAMVEDVIAGDIGERTRRILRDAAETGDATFLDGGACPRPSIASNHE